MISVKRGWRKVPGEGVGVVGRLLGIWLEDRERTEGKARAGVDTRAVIELVAML